MASDKAFHDYVIHDLFSGTSGIRSRPMFGGYGIYQDNIFFALITEGELYLKADAENQKYFEQFDSEPFVYTKDGKSMSMSYWKLPEEVMENRAELPRWIERLVNAAMRSKKGKPKKEGSYLIYSNHGDML